MASLSSPIWDYNPSFSAAVGFTVVFGVLLVSHSVQAFVLKKVFCLILISAVILELLSFVARVIAVQQLQNSSLAHLSQMLVLLAPLSINVFVSMVLARLVYFLMPNHRMCGLHASSIAFILLIFYLISVGIQVPGSLIATPGTSLDRLYTGLHVYMGGIAVQEIWILVTVAFAVVLWIELRKLQTGDSLQRSDQRGWRKQLCVLFAVLSLLTVRILFRLIQFSAQDDLSNPVQSMEWFFYAFEAGPMALAVALLSAFHPGRFLNGPFSEFPDLTKAQNKVIRQCCREAKAAAKLRGIGWFGRLKIQRKVMEDKMDEFVTESWELKQVPSEVVV